MTLYLNGTITKDDFLNHLSVKQDELKIMKGMYQKEKKAHPVRTGTHNYATKKGCEAVEKCYQAFDDLILMAEKNADDKKALAYASGGRRGQNPACRRLNCTGDALRLPARPFYR